MPMSLKTFHLRSLQADDAFHLIYFPLQLRDLNTLLANCFTGVKARLFHKFAFTLQPRVYLNQHRMWIRCVKSRTFSLDRWCFDTPLDA